jgi:hypothetical protein
MSSNDLYQPPMAAYLLTLAVKEGQSASGWRRQARRTRPPHTKQFRAHAGTAWWNPPRSTGAKSLIRSRHAASRRPGQPGEDQTPVVSRTCGEGRWRIVLGLIGASSPAYLIPTNLGCDFFILGDTAVGIADPSG